MNLWKNIKKKLIKSDLNRIIVTKLSKIKTINGDVMHVIKKNEKSFKKFGEAYFSWIECNSIKGWKKHNKMIMNLVVPIGNVKFVFLSLPSLSFKEIIIGQSNYCRLTVPSNIWFGFKGLSDNNLILNIASIMHDPNETETCKIDKFEYNWG